jgi:hypothetical protein
MDARGNVWAFLAVAIVIGSRRATPWALPLLTKVTPFLGPVWFVARRQWRNMALTLAIPALIVLASWAASPHLWSEWIDFLTSARPNGALRPLVTLPPRVLLPLELPIAATVTVFAARKEKPWLLAVAMAFANPVLTAQGFLVLSAIPRLRLPSPKGRAIASRSREDLLADGALQESGARAWI